jgi:hypothetical protein
VYEFPRAPEGETRDVQLWYHLGMTACQALSFSRSLDDRPICGLNSGRLARLVAVALAREQYFGTIARARCQAMIDASQIRPEPTLWPRH